MTVTPEMLAKSGSEHAQQTALFCWAASNVVRIPELRLMFAIPNGGMRDKITASSLKAEGVKAGVWDIFLPVSRHNYHGLFIEMKVRPNKLTPDQENFQYNIGQQGFATFVAYNWEEAAYAVETYLAGKALP